MKYTKKDNFNLILDDYKKGKPLIDLAKLLNSEGRVTVTGKQFTASAVSDLAREFGYRRNAPIESKNKNQLSLSVSENTKINDAVSLILKDSRLTDESKQEALMLILRSK